MNPKWIVAGLLCGLLLFPVIVIAQSLGNPAEPGSPATAQAMEAWAQMNQSGFGDAANTHVTSLEVFQGNLYAGASNWIYGGQVWYSNNGSTWEQVSQPGFASEYTATNPALIDMIQFNDDFFVCTGWGSGPGQIWRSNAPYMGNWVLEEEAGFGDPDNMAIISFGIFSDTLYVTTQSGAGLEIWRKEDGFEWSRVVDNGLGNAHNSRGVGLMVFNGYLYAAVENETDGAEIWRTPDGLAWEAVASEGFDASGNSQVGGLAIYNGFLYVGTRNDATGSQVWRTNNGTTWAKANGDGFGDANNYKVESLVAFDGGLYAATANEATGIEVWRSYTGDSWEQINQDGFGDGQNLGTILANGTVIFQDDLYFGTRNEAAGGQVWTMVSPLLNMASVSAGYDHTCAVTQDGGALCWGLNEYGRLGDYSILSRPWPAAVYELASGVDTIDAGGAHTCAVTAGGGALCWGLNTSGQLGINQLTDAVIFPEQVQDLESGTGAVTAGGAHTCALTTGGGAKCWGRGEYGQLGNGDTKGIYRPVDVSGLTSGVDFISTGYAFTCAVTDGGGARCWGNNEYGQLGNNSTTNYAFPVDVSGLASGVSTISTGCYHACALTNEGGVQCWGRNQSGQLGDDSADNRLEPVEVSGLASGVRAISAGCFHTCALTDEGGVKCWGSNGSGRLGDSTNENRWTPVDVVGLAGGVSAISAGGYHTCALLTHGGISCWGSNADGQLGDGTNEDRWTPVEVYHARPGPTSAPTSTPTPTPTLTPENTNTPTPTPTLTPENTNTPTPTSTLTPENTNPPTPTPTLTPENTNTPTPTPTLTPVVTNTPTLTPLVTHTPTPTGQAPAIKKLYLPLLTR